MSESNLIFEGDIGLLKDMTIAVIGYGNQGRAQATVMRDNGLNVIIGNIRDEARERAEAEGFKTYDIDEACKMADMALLLVPDEVAPDVYNKYITPVVRDKEFFILDFASGYNVFYGYIKPLPNMDVIMVAPRMIGEGILNMHRQGKGYPVLIGVEQDVSGKAWEYAKALAAAIGALNREGGVGVRSSFREETLVDLMTEHTWMPLLTASFLIYYKILVEEYNVSPEAVLLELYISGELAETAREMATLGLFEQFRLHSRTSQYGQLTRIKKFLDTDLWDMFRREAEEIASGEFAREWTLEQKCGSPVFRRLMDEFKRSDFARVEDRLLKALGRRR